MFRESNLEGSCDFNDGSDEQFCEVSLLSPVKEGELVAHDFQLGDVVWAKVDESSPYWPSCIIDPSFLPEDMQESVNHALDSTLSNRKFSLYMYGTGIFDFALSSGLGLFEANLDMFRNQDVGTSHVLFSKAISQALDACNVDVQRRLEMISSGYLSHWSTPSRSLIGKSNSSFGKIVDSICAFPEVDDNDFDKMVDSSPMTSHFRDDNDLIETLNEMGTGEDIDVASTLQTPFDSVLLDSHNSEEQIITPILENQYEKEVSCHYVSDFDANSFSSIPSISTTIHLPSSSTVPSSTFDIFPACSSSGPLSSNEFPSMPSDSSCVFESSSFSTPISNSDFSSTESSVSSFFDSAAPPPLDTTNKIEQKRSKFVAKKAISSSSASSLFDSSGTKDVFSQSTASVSLEVDTVLFGDAPTVSSQPLVESIDQPKVSPDISSSTPQVVYDRTSVDCPEQKANNLSTTQNRIVHKKAVSSSSADLFGSTDASNLFENPSISHTTASEKSLTSNTTKIVKKSIVQDIFSEPAGQDSFQSEISINKMTTIASSSSQASQVEEPMASLSSLGAVPASASSAPKHIPKKIVGKSLVMSDASIFDSGKGKSIGSKNTLDLFEPPRSSSTASHHHRSNSSATNDAELVFNIVPAGLFPQAPPSLGGISSTTVSNRNKQSMFADQGGNSPADLFNGPSPLASWSTKPTTASSTASSTAASAADFFAPSIPAPAPVPVSSKNVNPVLNPTLSVDAKERNTNSNGSTNVNVDTLSINSGLPRAAGIGFPPAAPGVRAAPLPVQSTPLSDVPKPTMHHHPTASTIVASDGSSVPLPSHIAKNLNAKGMVSSIITHPPLTAQAPLSNDNKQPSANFHGRYNRPLSTIISFGFGGKLVIGGSPKKTGNQPFAYSSEVASRKNSTIKVFSLFSILKNSCERNPNSEVHLLMSQISKFPG